MNQLPKVVKRHSKRVGRGYGSGKGGHTSGRGTKGQKARGSVGILFEGLKVKKSLLHRLPLQRGKGKLKARSKPIVVNVEVLNLLKDGEIVTAETLAKNKIVKLSDATQYGVKILGGGELSRKLTIKLPISSGAADKVQKAGGKVELS